MNRSVRRAIHPRRQRGLSLLGLLVSGIVIAVVALVVMKVFPTFMEYRAITRAVEKSASDGATPAEVARAFDRYAAIDDITSITGKDLQVTKNGDKIVVSFAYEKRIPLVGIASLLLDYQGSSRR